MIFKDRVVGSSDVCLTPLFMFDGTADLLVDVFRQKGADTSVRARVHLKVRFLANFSVQKYGRNVTKGRVTKDRFGTFWMGCDICNLTMTRCEQCGSAFYCTSHVRTVTCSVCGSSAIIAAIPLSAEVLQRRGAE